jgi:hypothetical protein
MFLDSGALIAVARGERTVHARLLMAHEADDEIRTHAMVLAQVWRDGRKQALLSRLVQGISVLPIDETLGKRAGELLALTKMSDPVDAAVVLLSHDGERVLTSDPDDLGRLARAARRHLRIIAC